jgi:hypothetical protein
MRGVCENEDRVVVDPSVRVELDRPDKEKDAEGAEVEQSNGIVGSVWFSSGISQRTL